MGLPPPPPLPLIVPTFMPPGFLTTILLLFLRLLLPLVSPLLFLCGIHTSYSTWDPRSQLSILNASCISGRCTEGLLSIDVSQSFNQVSHHLINIDFISNYVIKIRARAHCIQLFFEFFYLEITDVEHSKTNIIRGARRYRAPLKKKNEVNRV